MATAQVRGTNFWVDHTEPLSVLKNLQLEMDWPLVELLEGYKFPLNRQRDTSSRLPANLKADTNLDWARAWALFLGVELHARLRA
ncbi:hypothetical protein K432DRAFT_180599 [Lepidopterella palustris CBS 459.81]|uniref:Uncharacterized protein n=1 Tax=Lepidopterella palustris CBS 459.81 TaxID=1314670 RepID=A0A8E2E0E0_9PEZI|nr:hypothetical protein K432DRAFT_180599 [Lepidopterella palustris CBS 459.81]